MKRARTWLIAIPVVIVVLALAGPFVWFRIIQDDPPPKLSFADSRFSSTTVPDVSTTIPGVTTTSSAVPTAVAGTRTTRSAPAAPGVVSETDGPWRVDLGSIAGYRVKETVGVTSQDAVGRTEKVTGSIVLSGTTLQSGSFTVDMVSVESDSEQRDQNYRNNMAVDQYPTSTFALTAPVTFSHIPNEFEDIVVQNIAGNLTLRGVTRPVKFFVKVRRIQGRIEVLGAIDVKFEDYNIPNPSNGYARTEDHGLVEFLLAFTRG